MQMRVRIDAYWLVNWFFNLNFADISEVVGKDIGLMIRAFAAALEDENLLVRRGALDLLLQSMRVDSTAIRKAQGDDRAILMRAATGVVLRRDLSLNRRLYTWLLGSDEKSDHQIEYLKENALSLLHSTLQVSVIRTIIYLLMSSTCLERDDGPIWRIFGIKAV